MTRHVARPPDSADVPQLAGISQADFQQLVENNVDGVLVVDQGGTILFANPAAAEILGHARSELIGASLGRPMVSGETAEITIRRPGQQPAEIEMRAVEIIWSGQPVRLASLRDISARRAQEERQRQAQRLEAIGRLTAGVVHDLNNFVTVIESGLRLLHKRIDTTDPKISTLMKELFKGTERGAALIQRLLAFSRKQSLVPRAVDLNALIESLAAFLERTLGRGIAIRLQLDPGLGQVFIDPAQLEVAILNLAVNAKDAMEGRGVLRIDTSRQAHEHSFPPRPDDAFACLSISDTGCGMSQELLAQVFEPFFTTKSEGQGTGLGLSQVYGFITQSGGHIQIDSEVGKGTDVHLLLPRADAAGLPKGGGS